MAQGLVDVVPRRRILHVVESYGGGLVAAILEYVAATPEFEHVLAYTPSLDAPVSEADLIGFDATILLPGGRRSATRARRRVVRDLVAGGDVDVVHAHSGWASLCVRLAVRRRRVPIVYTPHCYAFLRRDHFPHLALVVWLVERILAFNTSVYASCSPYEHRRSRWIGSGAARVYVPNALPVDPGRPAVPAAPGGVRILGVGRLLPQKAPVFFAEAVEALRAEGVPHVAIWLGDGSAVMRARMERAGVEVRGWQEHDAVLKELAEPGTVLLHTARWEGLPFAILEASTARTPIVAREIACLSDFTFPHSVRRPGEVPAAVRELATTQGRQRAVELTDLALQDNNPVTMRARLLETYARALGEREVMAGRSMSR